MPDEPDLGDERAGEVATWLVRVYEMHEVIIAETGGMPGLREASLLHDFCVAVAEENMRITAGELTRPRTIEEIADWFRDLLGENA